MKIEVGEVVSSGTERAIWTVSQCATWHTSYRATSSKTRAATWDATSSKISVATQGAPRDATRKTRASYEK